MTKVYRIEYTAEEPVWGEVTLEADNADEAGDAALREVAQTFPDYSNIEIEHIEETAE